MHSNVTTLLSQSDRTKVARYKDQTVYCPVLHNLKGTSEPIILKLQHQLEG